MLKITSGTTHTMLAKQLSQLLKIKYVEPVIQKFPSGEFCIELPVSLHEDEIIILQSTCEPVHDNLIELLLLADAAKISGAKKIIALMPYFGYSRQNKSFGQLKPIGVSLIAKLIESSSISEILTIDLHSHNMQNFFNIKIHNIGSLSIFAEHIQPLKNVVIVSPDLGGIDRANIVAKHFGANLVTMKKIRTADNNCEVQELVGDVLNRECVIIDDIVDTANTLCNAARLLKDKGAKTIIACVTHALFSEGAVHNITESTIERIFISDSVKHPVLPGLFTKISIAPAIAEYIQNQIKI